jgi:hypothetical protein
MTSISYNEALADYRDAFRSLYRPRVGSAVERGAVVQSDALPLRIEALIGASRHLGDVLTEAADSENVDVREIADLKLLASAATDLAMAHDLMESDGITVGIQRSGSTVLNDPELRAVLDAPFDPSFMSSGAKERAALPADSVRARAALKSTVLEALKVIPSDAAEVSIAAFTGAANFQFGPATTLLSGGLDEILRHVPDTIGLVLRNAARLIGAAVRKLWAAFGKSAQEQIQKEAESWWKDVWHDGALLTGLLLELYQTKTLNGQLSEMIANASEGSDFNAANRQCEALVGRFGKIKSVLKWVLKALGWLKVPLVTAAPWGPIAAYTIYVAVFGYSVYAGGDYLDTARFQTPWLNHVVGIRSVVEKGIAGEIA